MPYLLWTNNKCIFVCFVKRETTYCEKQKKKTVGDGGDRLHCFSCGRARVGDFSVQTNHKPRIVYIYYCHEGMHRPED